ncbi:MAG TPA: hypothetical protein VJ909_01300 [Prolixibacteraceae bacterium]|nr:hypothetical protein [Prolixibacteraceae bacterium]
MRCEYLSGHGCHATIFYNTGWPGKRRREPLIPGLKAGAIDMLRVS